MLLECPASCVWCKQPLWQCEDELMTHVRAVQAKRSVGTVIFPNRADQKAADFFEVVNTTNMGGTTQAASLYES